MVVYGAGGAGCLAWVMCGEGGEDGLIQGYLDEIGVEYCGSGSHASSISFNKNLTIINSTHDPEKFENVTGRYKIEIEEEKRVLVLDK